MHHRSSILLQWFSQILHDHNNHSSVVITYATLDSATVILESVILEVKPSNHFTTRILKYYSAVLNVL